MWISKKKFEELNMEKAEGVSKATSDALRAIIEKYDLPVGETLALFARTFGNSLTEIAGEDFINEETKLSLARLEVKGKRVDEIRKSRKKK